jgi:hypothetical protein
LRQGQHLVGQVGQNPLDPLALQMGNVMVELVSQ